VGQAGDEALVDGVADPRHDDRDGLGRLLDEPDRRRARRHDDVDLQAHQLVGQRRQPIYAPVGGSVLKGNLPALAQAAIAEAVAEILQKRAIRIDEGRQHPDHRPLCRRLLGRRRGGRDNHA
jgi:hypothetical protein